MNEFTKEELEEIRHGICHLISVGSADSQWNKDMCGLKTKIQSMIENYCEHENSYAFNAYPEEGTLKMCEKCMRFFV